MRSPLLAFSFLALSAAASAQVTVPNTFVSGTPAKAADVNANFQALANGINALAARVAKLEGQITAADLVGTYTVNRLQTELGGSPSAGVEVYVAGGTFTLAADGTGSFSANTETGSFLALPSLARGVKNTANTAGTFTWSLTNGVVAVNLVNLGGSLANLTIVAGGRLLILTSSNQADGTCVILLCTRTS